MRISLEQALELWLEQEPELGQEPVLELAPEQGQLLEQEPELVLEQVGVMKV